MKRRKVKKRWDAIAQRFPPDAKLRGAEVGVWKGQCSAALLSRLLNLTLYMVDRWSVYSEQEKARDPISLQVRRAQQAFASADIRARRAVQRYGRRAKILKMSSAEAVCLFEDATFDFVFIDGDHSYEGVRDDIERWLAKVKPGGWLCGHDYTRAGKRPGITRAVDEAFRGTIEADDDSTWFYRVGEDEENHIVRVQSDLVAYPAQEATE